MIDYQKLKTIFPNGLPEAHIAFATVEAGLSYQKLRREVGYKATNRRVWLAFKKKFEEETADVVADSVSITGAPASLIFTKTANLSATVLPANTANKAVTWTSSDTTIATVSNTGVVTAKSKAGNVTITVTTSNGKTATAVINVKAQAVTGVTMSPKTGTVEAGKTIKLSSTVAPTDATNKNVTYTSSDATKATVATDGTVTAKPDATAGAVTITVTTADGNKTDTAVITITVPAEGS